MIEYTSVRIEKETGYKHFFSNGSFYETNIYDATTYTNKSQAKAQLTRYIKYNSRYNKDVFDKFEYKIVEVEKLLQWKILDE